MLATQLNDLVRTNQVSKFSVIQLDECASRPAAPAAGAGMRGGAWLAPGGGGLRRASAETPAAPRPPPAG